MIFDRIIPNLFLNPKDEEDWINDPIEFIRKEEDKSESCNNLKNISKNILKRICHKNIKDQSGDTYLMVFMKYAADIFTSEVDPRTN